MWPPGLSSPTSATPAASAGTVNPPDGTNTPTIPPLSFRKLATGPGFHMEICLSRHTKGWWWWWVVVVGGVVVITP